MLFLGSYYGSCALSRNAFFLEMRMKRRRSRSGSEISQGSSTYGSSSNLQAEDVFPVENGDILTCYIGNIRYTLSIVDTLQVDSGPLYLYPNRKFHNLNQAAPSFVGYTWQRDLR